MSPSQDDLIAELAKSLRVTAVNYHLLAHEGIDWSLCRDSICAGATRALFARSLHSDLHLFSDERTKSQEELDLSEVFSEEQVTHPSEEKPCR